MADYKQLAWDAKDEWMDTSPKKAYLGKPGLLKYRECEKLSSTMIKMVEKGISSEVEEMEFSVMYGKFKRLLPQIVEEIAKREADAVAAQEAKELREAQKIVGGKEYRGRKLEVVHDGHDGAEVAVLTTAGARVAFDMTEGQLDSLRRRIETVLMQIRAGTGGVFREF